MSSGRMIFGSRLFFFPGIGRSWRGGEESGKIVGSDCGGRKYTTVIGPQHRFTADPYNGATPSEETYMRMLNRLLAALLFSISFGAGFATAADNLKILVPANPGGGWDQTG